MKIVRRTLGALLLLMRVGGGTFHLCDERLIHRPVPTARVGTISEA